MAANPSLVQKCLQQASQAGRAALDRCVEATVANLQEAEGKSVKINERDDLRRAWMSLQSQKIVLVSEYPKRLLSAFNEAASETARAEADSGFQALRRARAAEAAGSSTDPFAGLSLVDDAEVSAAIESSRLLQALLPVVDETLSELNALICSAQGLSVISPEDNPVRPELFTRTLRELIQSLDPEPGFASAWLQPMTAPLAQELKALYGQLIQLLKQAKVQAAGYRVLQTPSGTSSTPGAPAAESGPSPAGGGAASGAGRGTPGMGGPSGQGTGGRSGNSSGGHGSHGDGGNGGGGRDDGRAGGTGRPQGGGAALPPTPQLADLSSYAMDDALFQDFLFRGASHADVALDASYYAQVEEELATLRGSIDADAPEAPPEPSPEYRAMPAVDRPARLVDMLSQLSSKVWGVYAKARERSIVRTELRKDAENADQVLGLEVVHRIVNQVAQDPRLLAPVREAMVALEPSLLRLAMVDPKYLSDEQHPGRRLIESVAQRSFRYNDEFSDTFSQGFLAGVAQAFNALNERSNIDSPAPFDEALTQLQSTWNAEDAAEQTQTAELQRNLIDAEERQAQADRIAYDISLRPDLEGLASAVLDFLYGPWALVMAQARMTDPLKQVDPGGYGAVISDLIWSARPEQTLKEPARLFALIPPMLGKLRDGLGLIGQGQADIQDFFDVLMKLHAPVLDLRRARNRKAGAPVEITMPTDVPIATAEQLKPKTRELPWVAPSDQAATGFVEALHIKDIDKNPEPASTKSEQDATTSESTSISRSDGAPTAAQVLGALRAGTWVDLFSGGKWHRAQLTWASGRGSLFMFVSHGGRPHSMTRRVCERLIDEGQLRLVDTAAVVDQAISAVA